jgi:tRNA/rRNA methyltransferase
MGENIGAAARAMANFGLSDLRLVAPRDGWPNARAEAMAAGGLSVIQAARIAPDVPAAIADLTLVFAATARQRELEKPVLTPRQAMARARAEIARGGRPGLLFGPEASGLSNGEIAPAAAILAIPVDPACSSLNLAQAVAVTAYEWLAGVTPDAAAPDLSRPRATLAEIAGLTEHLETELEARGFFFPPAKAETMRVNLRAAFARGDFTQAEVHALRGAIKSLVARPPKE